MVEKFNADGTFADEVQSSESPLVQKINELTFKLQSISDSSEGITEVPAWMDGLLNSITGLLDVVSSGMGEAVAPTMLNDEEDGEESMDLDSAEADEDFEDSQELGSTGESFENPEEEDEDEEDEDEEDDAEYGELEESVGYGKPIKLKRFAEFIK